MATSYRTAQALEKSLSHYGAGSEIVTELDKLSGTGTATIDTAAITTETVTTSGITNLTISGSLKENGHVISATGAGTVDIKSGVVMLTASGAATPTLAAATATTDDYKSIIFMSTTAQAHTITNSSPGFNNGVASKDVATFGAAIGNNFQVVAYQGAWYVVGTPVGVTLG